MSDLVKFRKPWLGVIVVALLLLPIMVWANGQAQTAEQKVSKQPITFYMALYDGLTSEYLTDLQNAFNAANPDIDLSIVPVSWNDLHSKLVTVIAGGSPPQASVIATRWLLDFTKVNAIADPTQYVSKATLDNIIPSTEEGVVNGKLMAVPLVVGLRILGINTDITTKVPQTMEELEQDAIAANSPDHAGLIMAGKKYTELTDFAYYFFAAGGNFFEMNSDRSFGKSTVNSPAGVQALTFMHKLADVDKVVQPGFTGQDRMEAQPVFYAGKAAYVMIGPWAETAMKQAGSTFKVEWAQIPAFAGRHSTSLLGTDSVAFFSGAKNLSGAGKFVDFFYQNKWKGPFDQIVELPTTKDVATTPFFQTPFYKVLNEAAPTAKGWPLIAGWDQDTDIIWSAVEKVLLEQATPKDALDEAAALIDKSRGP